MKEKEIKLLFEAGALSKCYIVCSPTGQGYNALFAKAKKKDPTISLDTRPRKAGDTTQTRIFKTIDSACHLVKRQVGFKDFIISL